MGKSKLLDKLTTKNVTTVFGAILFVLAFVFTFLITAAEPVLLNARTIILIVFVCAFVATIILWLITFLIVRKYKKAQDANQQKIKQALTKLKDEAVEESKKKFEESK